MYTDGLYEAHNAAGDLLGLDVVKSSLAASARSSESIDDMRQRFIDVLLKFEQGTAAADDTAFIVISGLTPPAIPLARLGGAGQGEGCQPNQ